MIHFKFYLLLWRALADKMSHADACQETDAFVKGELTDSPTILHSEQGTGSSTVGGIPLFSCTYFTGIQVPYVTQSVN